MRQAPEKAKAKNPGQEIHISVLMTNEVCLFVLLFVLLYGSAIEVVLLNNIFSFPRVPHSFSFRRHRDLKRVDSRSDASSLDD